MLNDFYYELLNLSDNISPMINEFDIFNYVNQAHFIFLSMDKSRIVYQYDLKAKDKFDNSLCHHVHNNSIPFLSNKLANYRIWDNSLLLDSNLDKKNSYWLAVSIFENQNHSYNDYSCVVLFNIFDDEALNDIVNNVNAFINENYLIQTMLHVNMSIKTYEKLSYEIDSFVEMISKKDIYMPHHMTNVASLCLNLASKLNLDSHQTNILYISALIHDIGKLYIPDKIINKPSTLDEREYAIIKTHSVKGEEIVQTAFLGMSLLKDVPQIIRSHHENYDGSGYPDKIAGDNILFLSRIIRVADSVDSMLSRFHYKEPFERSKVIDILIKNSGTHFDPKIVNIMIEILTEDESLDAPKLISEPHFFPKAILSFFYKDLEDLISLSGNLIIDSNGVRFIYHNEENRLEKFIPKLIYKATFSFFSQRKLYEYSTDVFDTTEDYFSLNNIVFIPADRYFSLSWDSDIYIKKSKDQFVKANLINLGVETVIFKLDSKSAEFILEIFPKIINGLLAENIDDIKLEVIIDLKIIKYYKGEPDVIFICKYENLSSLQKDSILKLLFRKQLMLRKSKHKQY